MKKIHLSSSEELLMEIFWQKGTPLSSLELLEEISVDSSIFSIATLNNTLYLLSDSQLARLSDLEASRAAETEG